MKVPHAFFDALQASFESEWIHDLQRTIGEHYLENVHGDTPTWEAALSRLPDLLDATPSLNTAKVGPLSKEGLDPAVHNSLVEDLKALHPWRKGPFQIGDAMIDTEWRSDWKWDRIQDGFESLEGKAVLDIGCGSGYHLWRMLGEGARWAVGLEPVALYVYQFELLQKYLGHADRSAVLGIPFELYPENTAFFDTVFSMGVLYHRKSPLEHLEAIRDSLKYGGQIVLETLVVEGDEQTVLVPEGRYAQMRNVWFLPSVKMLASWLKRLRFKDIEVVDVTQTTIEEQRSTEWMTFDSLATFLDSNDPNKTIEGYTAPLRATLVGRV